MLYRLVVQKTRLTLKAKRWGDLNECIQNPEVLNSVKNDLGVQKSDFGNLFVSWCLAS